MGDSLGLSRDTETVDIDHEELDDANKAGTSTFADEGEEISLDNISEQTFEPTEPEQEIEMGTESAGFDRETDIQNDAASENQQSKVIDEEL